MKKSKYISEIKKMKQNHKKYYPMVIEIMDLYKKKIKEYVDIDDKEKICTLVELVDIGYLDGRVVVIKKYFDDVKKIIYTGGYPLTPAGENYLENEINYNRKKELLKRTGLLLGSLLLLVVLYVLMNCE